MLCVLLKLLSQYTFQILKEVIRHELKTTPLPQSENADVKKEEKTATVPAPPWELPRASATTRRCLITSRPYPSARKWSWHFRINTVIHRMLHSVSKCCLLIRQEHRRIIQSKSQAYGHCHSHCLILRKSKYWMTMISQFQCCNI